MPVKTETFQIPGYRPDARVPGDSPRGHPHPLPGVSLRIHLLLQRFGPVLRIVCLLLQRLDLSLYRLNRRRPGHLIAPLLRRTEAVQGAGSLELRRRPDCSIINYNNTNYNDVSVK